MTATTSCSSSSASPSLPVDSTASSLNTLIPPTINLLGHSHPLRQLILDYYRLPSYIQKSTYMSRHFDSQLPVLHPANVCAIQVYIHRHVSEEHAQARQPASALVPAPPVSPTVISKYSPQSRQGGLRSRDRAKIMTGLAVDLGLHWNDSGLLVTSVPACLWDRTKDVASELFAALRAHSLAPVSTDTILAATAQLRAESSPLSTPARATSARSQILSTPAAAPIERTAIPPDVEIGREMQHLDIHDPTTPASECFGSPPFGGTHEFIASTPLSQPRRASRSPSGPSQLVELFEFSSASPTPNTQDDSGASEGSSVERQPIAVRARCQYCARFVYPCVVADGRRRCETCRDRNQKCEFLPAGEDEDWESDAEDQAAVWSRQDGKLLGHLESLRAITKSGKVGDAEARKLLRRAEAAFALLHQLNPEL